MKLRGRSRPTPGTMNSTERAYAQEVLEPLRLVGKIKEYYFEKIKLRLAHKTFYTPDYFVVGVDSLEFHEVQGEWEDDAIAKFKIARDAYWWFDFFAYKRVRGVWLPAITTPASQSEEEGSPTLDV